MSFGFGDNSENAENENIKEKVLNELKGAFRPEFLNRLDDIIVFTKLSKDEIKQIANNMLSNLAERLKGLDINITFDDSSVEKLAEAGFDPIYGARPLRRVIQTEIEDNLSEKILDGSVKGGQSVVCKYDGQSFIFE